jgi:hypothetical protein
VEKINNTKMKERLTKQDLMKLYDVDRLTIEDWISNRGLPMIIITSHSKYIRREDLIEWENSLIGKIK